MLPVFPDSRCLSMRLVHPAECSSRIGRLFAALTLCSAFVSLVAGCRTGTAVAYNNGTSLLQPATLRGAALAGSVPVRGLSGYGSQLAGDVPASTRNSESVVLNHSGGDPLPAQGGWSGIRQSPDQKPRPPVILSTRFRTTVEDDAVRAWSDLNRTQNANSDSQPASNEESVPRGAALADASQDGSAELQAQLPQQRGGDAGPEIIPKSPTVAGAGHSDVPVVIPSGTTDAPFTAVARPAYTMFNTEAPEQTDIQQVSSPPRIPSLTLRPPAEQPAVTEPSTNPVAAAVDSGVVPQPTSPGPAAPPVAAESIPSVAPETAERREPSMLDRIRDLYTPLRDETATETLRRPFRRLQSPWSLFERDAGMQTAETIAEPVASGAGTGEPASEPGEPNELILLAISRLEQQLELLPRDAAGRPADEAQWRRIQTGIRLLHLIADQPGPATSMIPGLPEEEQEFWQSLIMAITWCRETDDAGTRDERLNAALEHLRMATRKLQSETPLRIHRLTFCNSIRGFGTFDAFPSATFRPGQPVLLYAELQNFRSQQTIRGTYRTEFSAMLEITRFEETDVVETIRLPAIIDDTVSERTDYYQSYELTIPAHLRPGHYIVRLTLHDQADGRSATAEAGFDVR